jgi:hypothetical protein
MAMAPLVPPSLPLTTDPIEVIDRHPVPAVLIAVAVLAALVPLCLIACGVLRTRTSAENLLTVLAAGIATTVAAQGMWQFFGDVLHFSGPLRVLTFAFIEVSVITSAVRARASMRARHSAGVDGIAVWVLTCLSAVLSSLDAQSFGETVLRLTAPLVAAWLWERGMALERIRITGRTPVRWRLTPERVLVRIGLADPTERDIGEVDAHRRLMRLALAAKHARAVRTTGTRRAQRKALARLDRAMERTVEHGGLGTDPARQDMLIAQLGVLYNTESLLDLTPDAPWAPGPSDRPFTDRPSTDRASTGGPSSGDVSDPTPDPPGPPAPDREAGTGQRTAQLVGASAEARADQTDRTALFLDALTRHGGSVPAARADMESTGHTPPSRGYAYQLRKKWNEQTIVNGRLTRVI